jgi:hypothetical protein
VLAHVVSLDRAYDDHRRSPPLGVYGMRSPP